MISNSDGGISYYGYHSHNLLTGLDGATYIYDSAPVEAYGGVFANAPSSIRAQVTSGLTTGFLFSGGVNAGLSGTGACTTITTQLGGAWGGSFKCTGTTGASTAVITPGITATNGWSCSASDITTANALRQSATNTTTCTIGGTVNANDVITWTAIAF